MKIYNYLNIENIAIYFTQNNQVLDLANLDAQPFLNWFLVNRYWWQWVCRSLFLDLKKAFDLVAHEILLSKMKLYNVTGISLKKLKSYPSNRTQVVKDMEITSTQKVVMSGVPRGSILGPTLSL